MIRYYVYIMASLSRVLYVGTTRDVERRAWEHRNKKLGGFTARYNVNRLVYFERYDFADDAVARERQLKRWRRSKKVRLIEEMNPEWNDLALSDEEFEKQCLDEWDY